jgi:hypothetical protein
MKCPLIITAVYRQEVLANGSHNVGGSGEIESGAGGIRTPHLLTASLANVVTKDAFTFKMVDLCL